MKKITAMLTALSLICTLAACSEEGSSSQQSFTAQKLSDAAYKPEKIKLPDNAGIIFGAVPFSGGEKICMFGSAEVSPAFWTCDRDFTKFERSDLPDFDCGITYTYALSKDGEFADFVVHADYGDLPAPDTSSPDYDAAKYDAAAEYSVRLVVYSADGKVSSDVTVTDFPTEPGKRTMLGDAAFDGKHIAVNIDGGYELFSVDGSYIGALEAADGETVCEVSIDSSGTLVAAVEVENGTVDIRRIDTKTGKLEGGDRYVLGESVQQLRPGSGEYSLYIRTRTTIYGIKSADSEPTALFDVNAANINVNTVNSFFFGSDGSLIICLTDYSKWQSKLIRYIPCDPSEAANTKKLRIGVENSMMLDTVIDEFNDSGEGVQVERVLYERSNEEQYNESVSKLDEDAISGNLPDVMIIDYSGRICDIDLQKKGAFIDLVPFMEKDETLRPDDIFPNVLEALSTDGKIYSLPERFCVDMGYICKKKWADKLIHGDFNFNTYMDAVENRPEGMKCFDYWEGSDKWSRMRVAVDSWWIDSDTASCNFDSDSYIRYLRYVAAGGNEENNELIYADPTHPTEEEIQREHIAQQRQYLDDKTLFCQFSLANFEGYMNDIKGSFGGEEVAYLGLPREDGAHTYIDVRMDRLAITKDCKMPEEAWKFISYIMNYDYEGNGWSVGGFPLTEKAFYALADQMRFDDKPRYSDIKENGYPWSDGEKTIGLGPLTDDDIEFIHDCILAAEVPPETLSITNSAYWEILDEERNALVSGEQTPEQTAKYLQDRIGTFLSENY